MEGSSYLYWVENNRAYPVTDTEGSTDGCVRSVKIEIPGESRTEDRDLWHSHGYLIVQNRGCSFFEARGILFPGEEA